MLNNLATLTLGVAFLILTVALDVPLATWITVAALAIGVTATIIDTLRTIGVLDHA